VGSLYMLSFATWKQLVNTEILNDMVSDLSERLVGFNCSYQLDFDMWWYISLLINRHNDILIYYVVKLQLINLCICLFQVSSAFLFCVSQEIWNKKCWRMCMYVCMPENEAGVTDWRFCMHMAWNGLKHDSYNHFLLHCEETFT
jgi:hypothetical protein